ncbi:unnamed protein product [Phytophthora fragariaefolia]|uniref:Unnamed protein product n=1 Tax=Phytophthora fragariaefolia TaxID=1490495 RepID=A0A9W6YND5_9STRA|nr:unnamed protein product [Phytophthora fragariaefolia]
MALPTSNSLRLTFPLDAARCNTTLALKAANSYSLDSWKAHQTRKTHCDHEQKFLGSQPQLVSSSSQSSVHSSTSNVQDSSKISAGSQPSQYYQELRHVRRELQRSKHYQARHERDVANVINALTSLVSDQQGDLDSLQRQVNEMTEEIEALKKDVERLRRKEIQQRRVPAVPQKKVPTTKPFSHPPKSVSRSGFGKVQGKQNTGGHYKIKPMALKIKSSKRNNNLTDMDIFEKRFRLS